MSLLAACATPAQTASTAAGSIELAAPQTLIGSTPQVLTAEFGQPTLLRVDGTAQVWLYHSSSCALNLILYPDTAGVPRVAMATAADGSTGIENCPASLQQSHIESESDSPATAAALEPPASS